jgi:hypothetical protein
MPKKQSKRGQCIAEQKPQAKLIPLRPFVQRLAAKRHHHSGKSCQRHRDLSGGRQGFTWFHRFGLDRIQLARTNTKFRQDKRPSTMGGNGISDTEYVALGSRRIDGKASRARISVRGSAANQRVNCERVPSKSSSRLRRCNALTIQRFNAAKRYSSLLGQCLRLVSYATRTLPHLWLRAFHSRSSLPSLCYRIASNSGAVL